MKKFLLLLAPILCFSCSKDETPADSIEVEAPESFVLSTTVSPSNGGLIDGVQESFRDGEEVSLIASPSEEFDFKEWQGDITGSENPLKFVMSSNKELVAVFEKKIYSLNFDILGKWYFQSPGTTSSSQKSRNFSKQSGNTLCSIKSIEFRDDGTYTMVADQGEFEGGYLISGSNSIDLGIGRMEDLTFSNEVLNFTLVLDSGCSASSNAQLLTYVPDDVFENELINLGYDDVLDNFVLTKDISNVTNLHLYVNEPIGEITGLESFKSLKSLELHSTWIKDLDVRENTQLERIIISLSHLSGALDLSGNPLLKTISINENFSDVAPVSIDFSNNPKLENVNLEIVDLGIVDVTQNPEIRSLRIVQDIEEIETLKMDGIYEHLHYLEIMQSSPYTEVIPFENLPNLRELILSYRDNIDPALLVNLESLFLYMNETTSFNFTKNINLISLNFSIAPNLQTLDLSGNSSLSDFGVADAPRLTCIQLNAEQLQKLESGELNWSSEWTYSLDCQ